MQLQTGPWAANVDGRECQLESNGIGVDGRVAASLNGYVGGSVNLSGVWDGTALRLVMLSDVNAASLQELFEGYLISTPAQAPPGQDIAWTLVGKVQATSTIGLLSAHQSNARRTEFGWFAHFTTVR